MSSSSLVQPTADAAMDSTLAPAPVPPTPTQPPTTVTDTGPIPMSFPAILRGPGMTDRFAHLRPSSASTPVYPKKSRRDEKEGKRWARRNDNARFAGNVHIVAATKQDYTVPVPSVRPTFPTPLPAYLPRTNPLPAVAPPPPSPLSASAGRFSLSLKGMRRVLRRSGPRTEVLVREIEDAVVAWLEKDVWLNPDAASEDTAQGSPIGTLGVIAELSQTHAQLVWAVADDAFARYVVHCCARYHNIVSFSKDISGTRLTYLLRPTHTASTHAAPAVGIAGLDTPPPTDESALDPESDFVLSDVPSDVESDVDGPPRPKAPAALSDIDESRPGSPWSVVSDPSAEADDEDEPLAQGVRALTLSSSDVLPAAPQEQEPASDAVDTSPCPRARVQYRQSPLHARLWDRQRSSPSRSPARRGVARYVPVDPPRRRGATGGAGRSFYDYLFC